MAPTSSSSSATESIKPSVAGFESRRVRAHLENALGKSPADVLLRHMKNQYGIDIMEGSAGASAFCPAEPLEKTLSDVLGQSYAAMLVGELAAESGSTSAPQAQTSRIHSRRVDGGGSSGAGEQVTGRRSSVGSVIAEVHAA
jgi:hypothetical protein